MVEVPWDKVQRECGLKLFGLAFLREEILSWRRHYPEVLKLMVNTNTVYERRHSNSSPTFMFRGTPCSIRNILASRNWFRIEGEKCQPAANFFALRTHILYCLPLNCYQKQPFFRKCNLFVIFEKNSKC